MRSIENSDIFRKNVRKKLRKFMIKDSHAVNLEKTHLIMQFENLMKKML